MHMTGERQWGVILALTATVVVGWVLGFAAKAVQADDPARFSQPASSTLESTVESEVASEVASRMVSMVEVRPDGVPDTLESRSALGRVVMNVPANNSGAAARPVLLTLGH